jgi:hypothetical protein
MKKNRKSKLYVDRKILRRGGRLPAAMPTNSFSNQQRRTTFDL